MAYYKRPLPLHMRDQHKELVVLNPNSHNPYVTMNQALFEESALAESAVDLLHADRVELKKIPPRIRIMLEGLRVGRSASQVNTILLSAGLVRLYPRSFPEATMIYALDHRLSVQKWLQLYEQCEALRHSAAAYECFPHGNLSLDQLHRFLETNSEIQSDSLVTKSITRQVAQSLSALTNEAALMDYLQQNLHLFSEVREKTRYYFCKYLYYFLVSRAEDYLNSLRSGIGINYAAKQIRSLFRGWTYLDRHKSMCWDDIMKALFAAPISLSGIFNEFNYFYYDYVTQPWTDLLLEVYEDDISSVPIFLKEKYLRAIKRKPRKSLDAEFSAAIEMREQELDEAEGKERCGETALRKYLRGQMDMDRTTFLCFLLFFSSTSQLPPAQFLDEQRLNVILDRCGFPCLENGDDFDGFIREFLLCPDQEAAWELVNSEIMRYVKSGENSFLYRSYRQSKNYYHQMQQAIAQL